MSLFRLGLGVFPFRLTRRNGLTSRFSSGGPKGASSSADGQKSQPSGGGGSVFRRFAESVKRETTDADLKASVQKFEEKLTELNQNESIKRAKQIISKAKDDVLLQNQAIVSDVKEKAEAVKQVVGTVKSKVGSTISTAAEPMRQIGEKIKPFVPDISESEVVKKVGKAASEAEEKLLENTNIYQYGGFKTREQREKTRTRIQGGPTDGKGDMINSHEKVVAVNPEAGSSIVMHKESQWATKWNNFVDNNGVLQKIFGMKRAYEESNNVFVYFAREITNSISDKFSAIFSENETARAMKEIQARDPTFHLEKFIKFTTEQIIPEILDAFLVGDLSTLRLWCSEGLYNMLKGSFESQLKAGYSLEGRVLDMRHLELVTAKLLDNTPVVVFSFNTQQISFMRDANKVIVEGAEDNIENVLYVMALAKEEPSIAGNFNQITQGWKLVELAIRDKSGSW